MLGTYSYNEIFRKTVVAFGTLFNNIEIKRTTFLSVKQDSRLGSQV